jgi:hypothetical protein
MATESQRVRYRAIRACALVEILGFSFEAVWHGVLRPDFEATTARAMAAHLATVHLPLYLGVAGFPRRPCRGR